MKSEKKLNYFSNPGYRYQGLIFAYTILFGWFLTLYTSLFLYNFKLDSIFYGIALFTVQAVLYTGMFITAHDAMHGLIISQNRRINDFIGNICVSLYALFSFRMLLKEHWRHHKNPGSDEDPDFLGNGNSSFWRWYIHFMIYYLSFYQIFFMALIANFMIYILKVNTLNVYLLWILPALVSSIQLFYFGTYLPHKEPEGGYTNIHKAKSSEFNRIASFFSCFHFGCHLLHHEKPSIPWWRLYDIKNQDDKD